MSGATDILIKKLADTINSSPAKKVSPYDTQAEVRRVEGDIAWVHIPGGVDETPVQLTTNAKKGDIVQVRVSGGRAWLYGNQTSPPTDDTKATEANNKAETVKIIAIDARDVADSANEYAGIAKQSADDAQASANSAQYSSEEAKAEALRATGYAEEASTQAGLAQDYASEANDYAQNALLNAQQAFTSAQNAEREATNAFASASKANTYAVGALNSLGEVEKVVDALNWISTHGEYGLTADTEVLNGKWYFTRSGTSPNYTYTVVDDATGDPHAQGWYELTGVDTAISNYVASHLALTDDGLSLQTDGIDTRVLLSASGLIIKGLGGQTLAKYGNDAIIGEEGSFHIKIDGTELGFYNNAQKVAYINGNQLYITQSVVLEKIDIGTQGANKGQWSWAVHKIGGVNNLYLKWNG